MRRLILASLCAAFVAPAWVAVPASAQSAPPTVDARRQTLLKADLISLKTMLELKDGQVAVWDGFQEAVLRGIEESRSFGQAFCMLGGNIFETAKTPSQLAKRTSDLEILFRQRAKELSSLAEAETAFVSKLDRQQAQTYEVLSSRVLTMAMVPAYATGSNGIPSVCPPTANGMPGARR